MIFFLVVVLKIMLALLLYPSWWKIKIFKSEVIL